MPSPHALVSVEEARAHIRFEEGTDAIDIYIEAASQAAQSFCNRNIYPNQNYLDDDVSHGIAGTDPLVVNSAIKVAVLMAMAHFYENRQTVLVANTAKSAIELPMTTEYLLQPYRVNIGA